MSTNTQFQSIMNGWLCESQIVVWPIWNGLMSFWYENVSNGSYAWQRSWKLSGAWSSLFHSLFSVDSNSAPRSFLIDKQWNIVLEWPISANQWWLQMHANLTQFCWTGSAWSSTSSSTNAWSTTAWTTTAWNWWSDYNGDGIDDSEQSDYVSSITLSNNTIITLTATWSNVLITDFSPGSKLWLPWSWLFPAWVVQFSLQTEQQATVAIELIFFNVQYQSGLWVYKQNWSSWVELANSNYTLQQQWNDIYLRYTITDNWLLDENPIWGLVDDPITLWCLDEDWDGICWTISSGTGTEICTWGIDEDLDTFIDCLDSDCFGSPTCCSNGVQDGNETGIDCGTTWCQLCSWSTWSTEICTWGIDEDLDTFIDCLDSDCFGSPTCCSNGVRDWTETGVDCGTTWCQACVWIWTGSCADGILNGSETDVDCGWSCLKCVNGRRCTLNSDCTSTNCAYNVLNDWWLFSSRVLVDSPLWAQSIQTVSNIQSNTTNQQRREDTLLIKFKKDNKLLLPTYADTMILNSEERYVWYLVGKVASMYEQNGVAPLLMVRAIDQLFDYDVNRIDHVFNLASATPKQDDLANIYRVTFDTLPQLDALITQLRGNLAVEFVEKEPIYTVSYNDPQATNQRYLWKIEADKARAAWASGNASVVIAVIDNGFDLTHPDLQWSYVAGRDVANNDTDPSIPSTWLSSQYAWHGTHTLWLAWAATNNTVWIASVWWGVRVMPIKATLDSSNPENITHAIEAISYAVSQPQVKIISMSFWWPNTNSTLEALIAAHPEKIFVAAAWNENVNTIQYPAASPWVIAVWAVDANDQKASFSNYWSWIDITAPGTSILSTVHGWTYASYQWTSMATPIIASALWLLASLWDTNPFDTLMKTSDALPNSTHFQQGNLWSWRLNVCRAVSAHWIPCFSTNTWWLGRWICLVAWSTWTGWQTGTWWSTGTWWQTTTWWTASWDQQYPSWTIDLQVNNSSPVVGDVLQWTLDRSYTSHAPQYPAWTLDLLVNLPPWISFVSGSYSLLWDGTFQWYDVDNWDPVFVMALTGRPTSTTSTTRTFIGKIIFKTVVTSNVANLRVSVSAQNLCYWLPIRTYLWTVSCSTSQNRQSWLEMSTDTLSLTLNRMSTNTWSLNNWSTSWWWVIVTWWTANMCGNGLLEWNEQCDDGNKSSKDWCSGCIIESGWRCLPTSPSQCGTDDCYTHWKAYSEKNIFWTCCGWLSTAQVIPSSSVVTWVDKLTICYDSLIWQPYCDPKWSPSWWYVPTIEWWTDFVMNDSCRSIYKDYYQEIMHQLQWERTVCLFADVAYDEVRFKDITSTKQKESIELLRNACIVQWIGSNFDSFWPKRPITRAELIKMVIKLIQLSEWTIPAWDSIIASWSTWNEVLFFDVPVWFWWTPYIEEAIKRWLLLARAKQWLMTFFKPYATVTREEFVDLVRRIPEWQVLSRDMIIDLLDKRAVVTRAAAAEILVKKFLPVLQPYFYYQGNQEEYYWQLADELRWKNYKQQYDILLQQIDKLEEKKEIGHGSPDSWLQSDYDPYRMQQFIRKIIN
jgi:cysteine-rich repeat protein